jgi:imidazole glycerol-phosphate synthase subunit HisH
VIALIDYGAGNLTSVRKGFAAAGADLVTPQTPAALADVSGIVVPGVGHFSRTASLNGEWRDAILDAVRRGRLLLGICLGMQWLFEGSEEAPAVRGVGLFKGSCYRLRGGLDGQRAAKVPHVGWNTLESNVPSRIHVPTGTSVYFTHSYAAPIAAGTVTTCRHGGDEFTASVEKDNVFGVQFHPEKSAEAGLQILREFVNLAERR